MFGISSTLFIIYIFSKLATPLLNKKCLIFRERQRVKSFAYGLPHLGFPGIHNLETLAMKCDSNFTFILTPTYNV